MTKQMIVILLVVAAVLGGGVYYVVQTNQAQMLTLTGKFSDVRLFPMTENATLVILDLAITDPSPVPFYVNDIQVHRVEPNPDAKSKEDPQFLVMESGLLSKAEITSYMEFHKIKTLNPLLVIGDKIPAGKTADTMIAVRFEAPPKELKGYTLRIRFRDLNGVKAEFTGRIP
ncbi:MAG: hypothetical protein ABI811_19635 [Acidobacteriota bacterium]